MKVVLVAHGFPPELRGGTENSVQALARGLAARGVDVVVVAGSMQFEGGFRTSEAVDHDAVSGAEIRVVRIHRADLYFDHWQKSASARVHDAFCGILREERPDLVHVHHWIRLTSDLVAAAAREGIPAALTLHDLWTTCLLSFRVRSDNHQFCEAPLESDGCLECAGRMPPFTPWMDTPALEALFAARRADLVRELELARAVIVPSRAHARSTERFLGLDPARLALRVVPHGRDLDLAPAPPPAPPQAHGSLVLGAWGHVHPLKGPDLILDAIARLPDPGRVTLHLAGGEGPPEYMTRLHAMAEGLDVHFHGPYAEGELAHHAVARAHAMVSGTRALESWGLVIDEAVALRMPLVLPRAGAYPERLDRGALFYEPRRAESLAEVLRRLLDEDGLVETLRAELPPLEDVAPPMASHVRDMLEVYASVTQAGAPAPPPADDAGHAARLAAEVEWDEALSRRTPGELGLT